ncbi:MAG: N-ethylammeline chlorohydrolase [Acidobacteria bacterium RIFCSPLOWO2_02_FULL_67_36]|nr:MAG: N-ethylammeline chlorohydrolase [Acidobacteria bacterium RIFCSPLOWO2_02_FULL_67_36]OFW22156.1 MAG: N-ethylammeline chlorohydrolase [Acidobacteria bacterium RIFCSPLOWO2_12_FULL_66_21]
MPSTLIRNATIVTMNDRFEVVEGSVLVRDGRIARVGDAGGGPFDRTIDAAGGYLLPGFVQTHIHLCQTLFRGWADDMPLLEWLTCRVWPMEAAHTAETLRASAALASAELLLSGTTTVLTMETVHDTDVVFETMEQTGMRAVIGKCMMDSDDGVPPRLRERTAESIDESLALKKRWDGAAGGRLHAAFAPRFAVSCSRELLEAVGSLATGARTIVHTHASENRDEVEVVRRLSGGYSNLEYLNAVGLATPLLCAAHCVWVTGKEQELLAERDVKVLHCPGSNVKLGSGIAPVSDMRARGISVSLGADGAACNNRLDMFDEMRLAAALQAVRVAPGALPARDVLWMATREGAYALGLDAEIGSIEPGKRADLIVVDRGRPHVAPDRDPWSTLVYAARGTDVRMTMVDGIPLVENFSLVQQDAAEVAANARRAARTLAARAGLA